MNLEAVKRRRQLPDLGGQIGGVVPGLKLNGHHLHANAFRAQCVHLVRVVMSLTSAWPKSSNSFAATSSFASR